MIRIAEKNEKERYKNNSNMAGRHNSSSWKKIGIDSDNEVLGKG